MVRQVKFLIFWRYMLEDLGVMCYVLSVCVHMCGYMSTQILRWIHTCMHV